MRIAAICTALALGLTACAPTTPTTEGNNVNTLAEVPAIYQARQDAGPDGAPVTIPAVKAGYLNENNRRQRVAYNGPEAANTIVVDPYARFLYHVLGNGEAMRFGVAVGKAGTGFSGNATIQRKVRWPSWTPTANMIRTEPGLYGPVSGGLPGGMQNPLGSRALYLYKGGRDTYYRIHGTMDPSSIGKATSAGCIRLFNQDIMDLFDELPNGSPVKVRTRAESLALEGPMTQNPQGYLERAGAPAAAAPVTTAAASGTTASGQQVFTVVSPVESAVRP